MCDFITTAIAHDSSCEPGDEWLFSGLAQDTESNDTDLDTIGCGCASLIVLVIFTVVAGLIFFL